MCAGCSSLGGKRANEDHTSVSLPELTHLADTWVLPYQGGSNFSLWGEAVSLDLPKLATVDGSINFAGNISSFV